MSMALALCVHVSECRGALPRSWRTRLTCVWGSERNRPLLLTEPRPLSVEGGSEPSRAHVPHGGPCSALPALPLCPKPRGGRHVPGWTEEGAGQEQVTRRRAPSPRRGLRGPCLEPRGLLPQGEAAPLLHLPVALGHAGSVSSRLRPLAHLPGPVATGMEPPCVHGSVCLGSLPSRGVQPGAGFAKVEGSGSGAWCELAGWLPREAGAPVMGVSRAFFVLTLKDLQALTWASSGKADVVVPGSTSATWNFPGFELPKVWEGVSYKPRSGLCFWEAGALVLGGTGGGRVPSHRVPDVSHPFLLGLTDHICPPPPTQGPPWGRGPASPCPIYPCSVPTGSSAPLWGG